MNFVAELAESLPGSTQRSPYPTRRRNLINVYFFLFFQFTNFEKCFSTQFLKTKAGSSSAKSSTLPLPHRLNVERPSYNVPKDRERDGYYR